MTAVLLSLVFGVSFTCFGIWYTSRQDLRLMDVRAKSNHLSGVFGVRDRERLRATAPAIALLLWGGLRWGLPRPLSRPFSGLLGLVAAGAGADWLVRRVRRGRRLAGMKSEWPVLLDGMAVAALAGLDLCSAFVAASGRLQGVLREETDKVVLRVTGNLPLGRAIDTLCKAGIPGAERLRSVLLQCEVLGTPVAATLDALALETSIMERQEMEGRFNALPFKMSLVTVAFLLPPVLMVSIAPHVLMFLNSQW